MNATSRNGHGVDRFNVETDSLLTTALKDEQTRNLLFYIEKELQKFLRDSSLPKIQFPNTLSQYQKQLIKHVSLRFGLLCAGHESSLILVKQIQSCIPRTSLEDFWKTRSRPRTKTINRQPKRGSHLAGDNAKSLNRTGAENEGSQRNVNPNAQSQNWQQYNNPYGNNYQSYANPYASHQQSAPSNPNHKSQTAPSDSNQGASSYSNPYAAATKTQYTREDMDDWVKSNQKRRKRDERKKHNRKSKARIADAKKRAEQREVNSQVPFFPNKPFDKKTVDSFQNRGERKPTRRPKQHRRGRNQSDLPQHILHIYDFDTSICTPVFLPRNSETIRESLSVFKSAKAPHNPFYHMCWNHNTERGCSRGNRCKWVHCIVGVTDGNYEMDHALVAFANEFEADINFVNPTTCLATFHDDMAALKAMDSIGENSLFKLEPYSKAKTERLSNELPPSFFGDEASYV